MKMRAPLCSVVLGLVCVPLAGWADVRLPAVISDNMVLQQEEKAPLWGWAEPGEKVTASFGGKSATATTDKAGRWSLRLEDLKAGTAGDLTISGNNSVTVKNVIVGEVWLCSGQSNMEFHVDSAANPKEEIAAANFPGMRMFTVTRTPADKPQDDCKGTWEVCSPETVGKFSAVGYYFGRALHKELNVPVGLIHSSWGGTPAQYWTERTVLDADPLFAKFSKNWEKMVTNFPQAKAAYDKELEAWKAAEAEGKATKPQPRPPKGGTAFGGPGCLFNGMIAPLVPYGMRGAIWYQGEANAREASEYTRLLSLMIMNWRQRWGSEFPFHLVQLANFKAGEASAEQSVDSPWAELREAQLRTLELPRTGMAVAIDIGDPDDIHPKNKQEVGRRLALSVLADVYLREVVASGPLIAGAQTEEGRIRLTFRFAEGMKAADGGALKGFAIAGEDKKFVWAEAEVQGDHILVSSPQVPKPVAVRYGWANNPNCNLVNEAGLPASPFRTDNWTKIAR